MAVGAILFALMNFLARLATASTSWASVACVRAFVGAMVAVGAARVRGSSLAAKDKRTLFYRSVLGTLSMLLTFYSISSRSLSLGNTVTLLNLSPVFLAVLAPVFLGERTTAGVALAITTALTGVVLVVQPTFLFPHHLIDAPLGVGGPGPGATAGFAVAAAVATSFAMLLLRRVGKTESTEAIAFHFSIFAAVVHGIIAAIDFHMPTPTHALFMVLAGCFGGLGQLVMTRAYALEHAARVSGMSYLSVVTSAVLGAVALGERPGPLAIAGMFLVVSGGVLVSLRRSRVTSSA